jgi:hypothetical protein
LDDYHRLIIEELTRRISEVQSNPEKVKMAVNKMIVSIHRLIYAPLSATPPMTTEQLFKWICEHPKVTNCSMLGGERGTFANGWRKNG